MLELINQQFSLLSYCPVSNLTPITLKIKSKVFLLNVYFLNSDLPIQKRGQFTLCPNIWCKCKAHWWFTLQVTNVPESLERCWYDQAIYFVPKLEWWWRASLTAVTYWLYPNRDFSLLPLYLQFTVTLTTLATSVTRVRKCNLVLFDSRGRSVHI